MGAVLAGSQRQTDRDFRRCRASQQDSLLVGRTPRTTPRDYSVGLILSDGSAKEIASISGEYSIGGTWREFAVPGVEAKGIYLSIRSSNDGKHAPMVNELEAKGEFVSAPRLSCIPFASGHSDGWLRRVPTCISSGMWGRGFPPPRMSDAGR